MESIIAKARKILALVEQGVEGEAIAAQWAFDYLHNKTSLHQRTWHESVFGEALENFRQTVWREACEAMRERCQERLDEAYEYDRDDDGRLWQFEKLYRRNSMIEDVLIPEPHKNE